MRLPAAPAARRPVKKHGAASREERRAVQVRAPQEEEEGARKSAYLSWRLTVSAPKAVSDANANRARKMSSSATVGDLPFGEKYAADGLPPPTHRTW